MGLLDYAPPSGGGGLLGDLFNDPGARLGLSMLAQASPRLRGLNQVMAQQDQAKQQGLQQQLMQSQIAENAMQNRAREQQMQLAMQKQTSRDRMMFGGAAGEGGQGAPSGGGASTQQQSGGIMALAQQLGIAPEAIQADYTFNDGKKIAEMLEARSKPNWQNIGGNLVNTNARGFSGGIQDQVQMGPDGRAMILRSNGGNPVMGAVPGSFDTYSAFKDIDNRTSARYSPGRPVLGPDGRQYGQSQLDEIGAGAPRAPAMAAPGMGGRSGPTNPAERGMSEQIASVPYDLQREMASVQRELQGGNLNPADRAQAAAYLQQLQGRASQQVAGGPSPAGALDFSPTEKAAQDAARARAVDTAKADVSRDNDSRSKVRSATENLTNADRAIELLKLGPTGSAVGSLVDRGAAVFGKATSGGNIAAQLDIVSANMVKNVPRFEGPQSNIDVEGYKAAAGRVADRSLPIEQRIAAANEVKYFEEKAIRQAGGSQGGGASGSWEGNKQAANLLPSLPPANTANRGKVAINKETGERMRSNGMQWVKE